MLYSSFVTVFLCFCFDLLTLWLFELVGPLAYVEVASTLMTSTWRDLEKGAPGIRILLWYVFNSIYMVFKGLFSVCVCVSILGTTSEHS